jgi:hypothetical protein
LKIRAKHGNFSGQSLAETLGMRPVIVTTVVALFIMSRPLTGQTLSDQVRLNPGTPVNIGVERTFAPMTIEGLARGAHVVLQARLSKLKSYLMADDENVVTDYLLIGPQVIAGDLPVTSSTPGATVPVVLGVWGGEVMVNGTPIIATDHNMTEELKNGTEYLLFLRKFGKEAGHYQIYNGGVFAIERGYARPLIVQSDATFRGASHAPLAELIPRIQRGAKSR